MPVKIPAPTIRFHFETASSYPRHRQQLKDFLLSLFKKEKVAVQSLDYIFCSDNYLLGINQQFLKHNNYTDIITFNLADTQSPVQGEIYISVDRVTDNARKLHLTIQEEFHRVIFHGALHLCGYKDKKPKEIMLMRQMEEYYLNRYHIRSRV